MPNNLSSPENDYLITTFTTVIQQFTASSSTIQKWTNLLLSTYSELHRHYHTITHISSMLQYFSFSLPQIKNPTAVVLAIIFHDWEYIPHSPPRFNEEQSIVHFEFFASELTLPSSLVNIVKRYITATIKHAIEGVEDDDSDLRLFLDFDLEVLGREREEYKLYTTQIRKEYGHLSDEQYSHGRRGVLEKFLSRERLFFSESFYERFEQRARENLGWEIGILMGYGVEWGVDSKGNPTGEECMVWGVTNAAVGKGGKERAVRPVDSGI